MDKPVENYCNCGSKFTVSDEKSGYEFVCQSCRKPFFDMKKTKTEALSVRVDKDLKEKFEKLAKKNRREPSDMLRILIEDAVNDQITVNIDSLNERSYLRYRKR